jgi:cobalt-zinc-cadmium efflux system outer membrane protein
MLIAALGFVLLQGQTPDSLSLAGALELAQANRGSRQVARARVEAARAGYRQAGTIPNPTGGLEFTEDTPRRHATIDQSLDWLLTRGSARGAASASVAGAEADSAQIEADIAAEVRRAFFGAHAARVVFRLAVEQAATSDSFALLAEHRFKSGDISRFEADAALLAARRADLAVSRAREVDGISLAELRRVLGLADSIGVSPLAGNLDDGLDLTPTLTAPESDVPGIRVAIAESTAAMLRLRTEKRARIPLPSVTVGAEWSDPGQPGETLGLLGFSMPIPIWNVNGGSVALAQAQADDATARAREARFTLTAERSKALTHLRETGERARLTRDSLFPAAQRLSEQATLAYKAGETGIVPVLEALRAEREISASMVDELLSFQEAVAEWNRLSGVAR